MEKEFESYEMTTEKGSAKKYIEAVSDLNPLYVDEEYAKKSKYKGVITPPTYAVVYSMPAMVKLFIDPDLMGGLTGPRIHGEQEFEFFKPVRIGDKISTEPKLLSTYKKRNLNFFEIGATSKNQDGEIVSKGKFTLIIPE
jgi:acyl dehydratase